MTWLEGVEPFFVMLFSASLHEAGHIFMMRTLGYRVRRVDILPMGALIVCPEGIPDYDEMKIALAGPLVSLFLALVSSLWFLESKSAISLLTTLINLVFGAFNLLPVRKLDGGKALFCFLSGKTKRAEKICSFMSLDIYSMLGSESEFSSSLGVSSGFSFGSWDFGRSTIIVTVYVPGV
jgi:Zn-dependent protease